MRVALLSERYLPEAGGLAASAGRMARGLAARGVEITVLALGGRTPGRVEEMREGGVVVRRLGPLRRSDDTLAAWLDDLMDRHRAAPFDLFHGHYLIGAGFLAAYAGRLLGVPAVVGARGNDLDRDALDPARGAAVRYALDHAAAVAANSQELAAKARALASGSLRVEVIANGVDTALFAPGRSDAELSDRLGIGPGGVVGFVGELREKKGVATLLRGARIAASSTPLTVVVVGAVRAGAAAESLEVFRHQTPEVPVILVPQRSQRDLPALYRLLDLLLLPSVHDGLPNALLEAMACGVAVVASSVGGIPDALTDGAEGRLVPPRDADALAARIVELLADPVARGAMGERGRATVLERFGAEREIEALLELYRRSLR